VTVTPVPTASTTPTAAPTVTATVKPTVTPTPGPKPGLAKLKCTATAHKRTLKVACKVATAPALATKLKFSLLRKGKELSTDRSPLTGVKTKGTFKLLSKPKTGKYVLKVTVLQTGGQTTQRVKFRL
jgi:hypothetical protein